MNADLLAKSRERVLKAKTGQALPTKQSFQNEFNGTEVIPSLLHYDLAAILIAQDLEERKPHGLGTLSLLEESDKPAWETFARKNPTCTIRMEDRSDPNFTRFVTGYASGKVVFTNVKRVNRTDVEKIVEETAQELE